MPIRQKAQSSSIVLLALLHWVSSSNPAKIMQTLAVAVLESLGKSPTPTVSAFIWMPQKVTLTDIALTDSLRKQTHHLNWYEHTCRRVGRTKHIAMIDSSTCMSEEYWHSCEGCWCTLYKGKREGHSRCTRQVHLQADFLEDAPGALILADTKLLPICSNTSDI